MNNDNKYWDAYDQGFRIDPFSDGEDDDKFSVCDLEACMTKIVQGWSGVVEFMTQCKEARKLQAQDDLRFL